MVWDRPETGEVEPRGDESVSGGLVGSQRGIGGIAAAVAGGEKLDVMELVGGWQGIAEACLPIIVFLTIFFTTTNLWWGVGGALILSACFGLIRLFQKQPLTQAISGVLGTAISALAVWFTDSASGYFLPGIILSIGYGLIILASIAFKYPIVGFIYGLVTGNKQWRANASLYQRCVTATLMWGLTYLLRGLISVPMFIADMSGALGVFRISTGAPVVVVLVYFTHRLLKGAHIAGESESEIQGV